MGNINQQVGNIYTRFIRPEQGRLLESLKLDKIYEQADRNTLKYTDPISKESVEVIDFLGGYGGCLLGHNHPKLVEIATEFYKKKRPILVQASVRKEAALLAEKLDKIINQFTGKRYCAVFGNSGAEAVEIAMKHAALAYREKSQSRFRELKLHGFNSISGESKQLLFKFGIDLQGSNESICNEINSYNSDRFDIRPYFLALTGSFHGKTNAALSITDNSIINTSVSDFSFRSVFIDRNDDQHFDSEITKLSMPLLIGTVRDQTLSISIKKWLPVAAFFIEPLQGEGGIYPLSKKCITNWMQQCSKFNIPIVADEIQCGMGRTGSFLYSQQLSLTPNYILLSKSLGGGIAKISVVLIDREYYLNHFSSIHSSTFAEDDFSCAIASTALDIVTDDVVQRTIKRQGDYLWLKLNQLHKTYPDIIEQIRGKGLMLGIVFSQKEVVLSNTLLFLKHYNLFGYVITSYLLNRFQIRIAPTLSGDRVIRIEPSYLISKTECNQLVKALDKLCILLKENNLGELLSHLISKQTNGKPISWSSFSNTNDSNRKMNKVAFIGHFINSEDIGLWDPSLACFNSKDSLALLKAINPIAAPCIYNRIVVKSKTGDSVLLHFIGLPICSIQIADAIKKRELASIKKLVHEAVDLAINSGCSVVGLGGFSSIITRNGKDLENKSIALTTGNSFTVATGIDAILRAAKENGISLKDTHAAIIGASGNIGSIMAEILFSQISSMTLIGRSNKLLNLMEIAGLIIKQSIKNFPLKLIVNGVDNMDLSLEIKKNTTNSSSLYEYLNSKYGRSLNLRISDSMDNIYSSQIVISASNSPKSLIFPDMISNENVIISDISVPPDVDISVQSEKPNAILLKGGLVNLPHDDEFQISGIPLEQGELYPCMAETILMGMENIKEHFSYGSISKEQVLEMKEIANKHGISLARVKTDLSF